jgi:endonuclease/exonuclease/phosphatase family metal-dependent hydrolase
VRFIEREISADSPVIVAGDFNDWGTTVRSSLGAVGMLAFDRERVATFPSRMPVVQLDYVYARGLAPLGLHVPKGRIWGRMSDHLPLIAEFDLPSEHR